MRVFAVLGFGLLLVFSRLAADESLAQGPEIVPGQNDGAWQPLFDALAGNETVFGEFTERRWFRVRRQPVVLTGELRLMRDRGLSLHYPDRTIIIDAQGIIVRDARGRTRHVRLDEPTRAGNAWLLAVMRFDRAELEKTFRLHAAREGDRWRLDFVPRNTNDDRGAGPIVVHGTGETITRIEMRPKPELRVEIEIGETHTDASFSDDEMRRFFR